MIYLITIIVFIVMAATWMICRELTAKKRKNKGILKEMETRADAHFERLMRKYSEEIALKLVNAEYWIGMTKEMIIDSKNRKPDIEEITAGLTSVKEILVYGTKSTGDVFVLQEGALVKFTDRPDNDNPFLFKRKQFISS